MVKKTEGKLVMYKSSDEALVCRPESEKRMLREWFGKGNRDRDEYERSVGRGIVQIDHGDICACHEWLVEKG